MSYNDLSKLYPTPGLTTDEKAEMNERRDTFRLGITKVPLQVDSTGNQYIQVTLDTLPVNSQIMLSGKIFHQHGLFKFTLIGEALIPDDITTNYDETPWAKAKFFHSGSIEGEVWECRAYYSSDFKLYFEIKGFHTTTLDYGLFSLDEIVYTAYPMKTEEYPPTGVNVTISNTPMGPNSAVCVVNQQEQTVPKKVMSSNGIGLVEGQYIKTFDVNQVWANKHPLYYIIPINNHVSGEIIFEWPNYLSVLTVNASNDAAVVIKNFYQDSSVDLLPEDGIVKCTLNDDPNGDSWLGLHLREFTSYQDAVVRFRGYVDGRYTINEYWLDKAFTVVHGDDLTIEATEYSQYVVLAADSQNPYISTTHDIAGFSKQSEVDI